MQADTPNPGAQPISNTATTAEPSAWPSLLIFVGFFVILYFLMIRPQQKRAKALQQMISSLEKGDEVVAASGIIGRIKDIKGDYVSIEVSENITFKLQKTAISGTLPKGTIDSINK